MRMQSTLEELREPLLSSIMSDGLSLGVFILDRDYRIVFWNRWLEKHTGMSAENCKGRNLLDMFPDIRDRGMDRHITRCLEEQTSILLSPLFHSYLLPIQIAKGHNMALMLQNVRIYPASDSAGDSLGAVIVIENLTEQIAHQEEISRLNRILRAIRNVNQLIVRADSQNEALDGACRILTEEGGYVAASIALVQVGTLDLEQTAHAGMDSKTLACLRPQWQDPEDNRDVVSKALETGTTQVVKFAATFRDGSSKNINCESGCSVPLVTGESVVGVLTVHTAETNLTGDDELGELGLLDEIAGDIAFAIRVFRTEEREKELRSRAQLQDRLAAVGQLAAGIAHDFNNILTGMIGNAQLVLMGTNLDQQEVTDVQTIVQQGQRAAKLIQQILDFSRKSVIQKRSLDLLSFLEKVITLLQRLIPETVTILFASPSSSCVVHADPTPIQQMVMNLVVNASDAMPDGGILRIQLEQCAFLPGEPLPFPGEMPFGNWVVLTVSDTGTGIPEDVLSHIYEPFFTTKEVGKGTGLGLSQVYGIVQQHDGFIDVKSHVGKGTTFRVYLPVEEGSVRFTHSALQETHHFAQNETILLVEDDPVVLDTIRRMLLRLGYQVFTACNGRDALGVYKQHHASIDLVLSDMVMPEMNGQALYRSLHQLDASIKMVLISGYPLTEAYEVLLSEAGLQWIPKPPTLSQLSRVLRDALAQ